MDIPHTYKKFTKQVITEKYRRIERDDRILDIIPDQTRAKGVELWEKIHDNHVIIIRLRLPYSSNKIKTYSISRPELESALYTNTRLSLEEFIKTS